MKIVNKSTTKTIQIFIQKKQTKLILINLKKSKINKFKKIKMFQKVFMNQDEAIFESKKNKIMKKI